jgi:hypothetical protein
MMIIGPFVLLVVIGAIVALATNTSHRHVTGTSGMSGSSGAMTPVTPPEPTTRRTPAAAEALGYLGGILAAVGLTLAVAQWWSDMLTLTRLLVVGTAAAALTIVGFFIPERDDPALARLRWFLWLLATAAAGAFGAVLAIDAFDFASDAHVALMIAGFVLVLGGALWAWSDRPLQQLTTMTATAVVVGTLAGMAVNQVAAGIAVWVFGVGLVVAGLRAMTPLPRMTTVVGATTAVVGAFITLPEHLGAGLPFVVATGIAVMNLAVSPRLDDIPLQRVLAAVGVITLLQSVPPALVHFARDGAVATGLVVWAAGVGLIALGRRDIVRTPLIIAVTGGVLVVGGAALTGVQSVAFATTFGLVSAVALVAFGMLPGHVLLSVFGSVGLLVNVPWAIAHFFPGEGRVPLLITVSGVLIIAVAVLLARSGKRLRSELGR